MLTTVQAVREEKDRGYQVLWEHLTGEGVQGKVFLAGGIVSVKALRHEKAGGAPRGSGWPILQGGPTAGIQ